MHTYGNVIAGDKSNMFTGLVGEFSTQAVSDISHSVSAKQYIGQTLLSLGLNDSLFDVSYRVRHSLPVGGSL